MVSLVSVCALSLVLLVTIQSKESSPEAYPSAVRVIPTEKSDIYQLKWSIDSAIFAVPQVDYGLKGNAPKSSIATASQEGFWANIDVSETETDSYEILSDGTREDRLWQHVNLARSPSVKFLFAISAAKDKVINSLLSQTEELKAPTILHHIGNSSKLSEGVPQTAVRVTTSNANLRKFYSPHDSNSQSYYSYRSGIMTVLSLDTVNLMHENSDHQIEWIRTALQRVRQRSNTEPILVIGEHPMYCYGRTYRCDVDALTLRTAIESLLWKYGVLTYISTCSRCGLNYSRSYPSFQNFNKAKEGDDYDFYMLPQGITHFTIPSKIVGIPNDSIDGLKDEEHFYHDPKAVLAMIDDEIVGHLLVRPLGSNTLLFKFVDQDYITIDFVEIQYAQDVSSTRGIPSKIKSCEGGLQFGSEGYALLALAFISFGVFIFYGAQYAKLRFRKQRSLYDSIEGTEMF